METFYAITNQALAILVQDVEGACEAALQTISKVKYVWKVFENMALTIMFLLLTYVFLVVECAIKRSNFFQLNKSNGAENQTK